MPIFMVEQQLCRGTGTNGMTNVQQNPLGPAQLQVTYAANVQTNQGAAAQSGVWVSLFNPSTQTSGFIDFLRPGH